jgi:LPXTG-motif cell wall-anchored protein
VGPNGNGAAATATATLTVVRLVLPTTGADIVGSFWIALVWSLLGVFLVLVSRRRPRLP